MAVRTTRAPITAQKNEVFIFRQFIVIGAHMCVVRMCVNNRCHTRTCVRAMCLCARPFIPPYTAKIHIYIYVYRNSLSNMKERHGVWTRRQTKRKREKGGETKSEWVLKCVSGMWNEWFENLSSVYIWAYRFMHLLECSTLSHQKPRPTPKHFSFA